MCEPKRGLCGSSAQCESWQVCDVSNRRCVSRPGFCSGSAECGPAEFCNSTTHTCQTRPGFCKTTADCPISQRCDTDPTSPTAYRCVNVICTKNEDCPGSSCDPETQRCRGWSAAR
jgi:hypothetical protein